MPDANEQSTLNLSQELRKVLSELIDEWQWEERYCALQGAFSVDKSEGVKQLLQAYFNQIWDNKSIKTAPLEFREMAGMYSDLSKSQLLFSRTDNPDLIAAWWPWGHGATVSLRLFQAYSTKRQEKSNFITKLLGIFRKN